jgi:hypothetical protein
MRSVKLLAAMALTLILSSCGKPEPGVQYVGLDDHTCSTFRTGEDSHLVVTCYLTPTACLGTGCRK